METLIKADIFFFVSTIVLVLISIGVIISLVYVIKILRNVTDVSKRVKEESAEIITDIHDLRGNIRHEGFKMGFILRFFKRLFGRGNKSKR